MQNSFDFGMDLSIALVRPFIEIRPRIGTTTKIQIKICTVQEKLMLLHSYLNRQPVWRHKLLHLDWR